MATISCLWLVIVLVNNLKEATKEGNKYTSAHGTTKGIGRRKELSFCLDHLHLPWEEMNKENEKKKISFIYNIQGQQDMGKKAPEWLP